MKYVVYDSNGEIVIYGESDVPDDHGLGTILENADGTTATHYVSNGVLVSYTEDQRISKASAPSYDSTWSNSTFSWVDSRNLIDAQLQTWEAIRNARDDNIASGFTWDGSKFDSDNISQQRIQGAVQLAALAAAANQPFSITWTLFDNSTRTLSGNDMISVGIALGTFVQQVYSAGVTLRQQIDAAVNTNQLHGITWITIS